MGDSRNGTPRRVLVAGGGVAALEAVVALRRLAGQRVAITVAAAGRDFVHRSLAVAEAFGGRRGRRFDLEEVVAHAGARLVPSPVVSIDAERHLAATAEGGAIDYELLVVACGAQPRTGLPGAITYWDVADGSEIAHLLAELGAGGVRRVVFASHPAIGWQLPLYELALMAHDHAVAVGARDVELTLVTHERAPLADFGADVSRRVREALETRGIAMLTGRLPTRVVPGALETVSGEAIAADRVVTLPALEGPRLAGLPTDEHGFIPVDSLGRVRGAPDVYAVGDVTSFPVKQGDLAARQADAVAGAIATAVGAAVEPEPFAPDLRRLLVLDGDKAADAADGVSAGSAPAAALPALARGAPGRFLALHLAELAGCCPEELASPPGALAASDAYDDGAQVSSRPRSSA